MLAVLVLVVVVVVVLVVLVVAKLEKEGCRVVKFGVGALELGAAMWHLGMSSGLPADEKTSTATPKDTRSRTSGIP